MSQPQKRFKSAFEFLMAGAKASSNPQICSSNLRTHKSQVVEGRHTDHSNCENNCGTNIPPNNNFVCENEQVVKKLKSCISSLKDPPSSFDPAFIASCWVKGNGNSDEEKVLPFIFFCLACDLISHENGKRNSIKKIACNLLRTAMYCSPKDVLALLCLSTYKLAPAHEVGASDQLGIGEHCIIKVICDTYGMSEKVVKRKLKEVGDLGIVAESGRLTQPLIFKPKPLTVNYIYDTFRLIAEGSGKDCRQEKTKIVKDLLVAARDCEAKYLVRLLLPKRGLQIGCKDIFIEALGHAAVYHEKHDPPTLEEAAKIVKQAYSLVPVFDKIVNALLNGGLRKLQETCRLSPGIPIEPALAKAVRSVADILKKYRDMEFTCEHKYDGERGQIHYMEDGRVEIYSRNLERSTEKFPDVALAVSRLRNPHVESFILDCEVVAYDRDKQIILPFQKLSTRNRKNVKIDEIKVDACVFAFDILYVNGRTLLHEPLAERRKHLYASFDEEVGVLQFATSITSRDPGVVQNFFQNAMGASFEGLVIKPLNFDSQYIPGKRGWLKLKKDSSESLWDTLDLVPIGAYYGNGKRAGMYGAFLFACYDSSRDEFQTICKAVSGISHVVLEDLHTSLSSKVISKPMPYYRYDAKETMPDVWLEPSEVWEVKAGGFTVSSNYYAAYGIVHPTQGLSLRNPCVVRIRLDKDPKQATSSEQVAEMYSGL